MLILRSVDLTAVEFELVSKTEQRRVHVPVIDGRPVFPAIGNDATESIDDEMDAIVRRRAAEELVRLRGAIRSLQRPHPPIDAERDYPASELFS